MPSRLPAVWAAATAARPNQTKYRAKAAYVHGRRFDSQAEAARYQELLYLGRAGVLDNLELQPQFRLVVRGVLVAVYRADFAYRLCDTGRLVVEDVKGVRTPVYRIKKRLVEALHGIQVREVTTR